jgi:hypothetical protein
LRQIEVFKNGARANAPVMSAVAHTLNADGQGGCSLSAIQINDSQFIRWAGVDPKDRHVRAPLISINAVASTLVLLWYGHPDEIRRRAPVQIEAINPSVNASPACVDSGFLNACRLFCRASGRYSSTSRSSDIYCSPHSIANSPPHVLPRGIASLSLPKIRPLSEKIRALYAIAR